MTSGNLTTESASTYTGLAASTLEKMRLTGSGPQFLKLGRAVRYRVADLDAWMAARVVSSTSQSIAA
ncbi:DNA-binding protein [Sphingomonas populi]|uniref:DNA-binding protein n=1 Tax=Sphingomonas populi TaxID=2484750 RepID=A0A4Q6XS41_9SPHN|nr:helix-turn-helix domain-containing protein [Sphingomonas populi]RZF59076.1 DNA-binding protein [Sphingomonas populi]